MVGSGKSSERVFLESVLEKGITHIADRGYASFEIIAKLLKREAYFIFRVKDNWLFEVRETLAMADREMPLCFGQITDELIIFKNDRHQNEVRLIRFEVSQSKFRLLTNRLDLTTLEVIILYAYRWLIELFFKYVKRTLNRLHLFNHSSNGVESQFYLLMTLAILVLKFKQDCDALKKPKRENSVEKGGEKGEEKEPHPSEWIRKMTKIFYEGWKISKKWLLIIKNSLAKVIDNELLTLLNSCWQLLDRSVMRKLIEKKNLEKDKSDKTPEIEFNADWNISHENKTFYFYRNEDKSITNSKDPSVLLSENCNGYKYTEERIKKHNESLRRKK